MISVSVGQEFGSRLAGSSSQLPWGCSQALTWGYCHLKGQMGKDPGPSSFVWLLDGLSFSLTTEKRTQFFAMGPLSRLPDCPHKLPGSFT